MLRTRAALSTLRPAWCWARRLRAHAQFRLGRPHDPDFRAFSQLQGDGLFLDIGASIGQSAYSFRLFKRDSPILSLEPLPQHRADLDFVRRVLPGFAFRVEGAAEHTQQSTLYLPVFGRYELPAYASLNQADAEARLRRLVKGGADPAHLRLREVTVALRRVDELDLAPAFVKIDVEGAEFAVLRGMADTLARHRPVLMIEKTAQASEWSDWLARSFDYRACVFDPGKRQFPPWDGGQAMNLFFLRA
jgi:FkbM family methyltransferase